MSRVERQPESSPGGEARVRRACACDSRPLFASVARSVPSFAFVTTVVIGWIVSTISSAGLACCTATAAIVWIMSSHRLMRQRSAPSYHPPLSPPNTRLDLFDPVVYPGNRVVDLVPGASMSRRLFRLPWPCDQRARGPRPLSRRALVHVPSAALLRSPR